MLLFGITPSASSANHPGHRSCPPRSGSTGRLRRKKLLKLSRRVSHSCWHAPPSNSALSDTFRAQELTWTSRLHLLGPAQRWPSATYRVSVRDRMRCWE